MCSKHLLNSNGRERTHLWILFIHSPIPLQMLSSANWRATQNFVHYQRSLLIFCQLYGHSQRRNAFQLMYVRLMLGETRYQGLWKPKHLLCCWPDITLWTKLKFMFLMVYFIGAQMQYSASPGRILEMQTFKQYSHFRSLAVPQNVNVNICPRSTV